MTLRSLLLPLLISVLWGLAAIPTTAQEQPSIPSQQHASSQAASSIPLATLPSVDTDALRAEDQAQSNRIGPRRYGTVIETSFSPERNGQWERLPSGEWLWRLRIQSRDAVSLSVAFTQFQLPDGASLYLYGPDGATVRGPYTSGDATNGQHWTPVVQGEELTIELTVPSNRRSAVDLVVGNVVHAYRSLYPNQSNLSKSGACNVDVACEDADPWRQQVRSVARYTFESGGSTYLCSGSLVNNTEENNRPFFLTAEHCISTASEATSMVFYWNYQNPTCREPGSTESGTVTDDDPNDQTSSGAVLRARYGRWHETGSIAGKPDMALVEIDDNLPLSYDLYFSGWSWRDRTTEESVTIHHPSGHGKRISFDFEPTVLVDYPSSPTCDAPGGTTHLSIQNWDLGTTEGGSSGAPLYDTDQRVVGVLSGGCAGCDDDGDADDNNTPDWYGRLAAGFNNGDYQGDTFADWLDPTNSGTRTLDGIPQIDTDDDTPPSEIEDLTVADVDTTSMTLSWTAPGDDGDQGQASEYDLRYDTTPIASSSDFDDATRVSTAPSPAPAGSTQTADVHGLIPDSTYHFAIVAIDDGLNRSAIGTAPEGTLLPDLIPPAPIRSFEVSDVNTGDRMVRLEWEATGDDQRRRRASSYDLRYAPSPIETASDFESATAVTGLPAPSSPGQQETFTVDGSDGLAAGETYYFALRAVDNAGNQSPWAMPDRKAVLVQDVKVSQGTAAPEQQIKFVLTKTQEVRVSLYDLLGRRVGVIFEREAREGFEQTVYIDSASGRRQLASGPYFLRFVGENFTETRKIMVVR